MEELIEQEYQKLAKTRKNDYVMFCDCGCNEGVVFKIVNEDGDISVGLVSDNFYIRQDKGNMSFKEKIKRIWYIIKGKEYHYFDILITKDELQKFKEFVFQL